jgi:hypothetical protein
MGEIGLQNVYLWPSEAEFAIAACKTNKAFCQRFSVFCYYLCYTRAKNRIVSRARVHAAACLVALRDYVQVDCIKKCFMLLG